MTGTRQDEQPNHDRAQYRTDSRGDATVDPDRGFILNSDVEIFAVVLTLH